MRSGSSSSTPWRPSGGNGDELDETLPPAVAYAGASHLILAAGTYERLRNLDYDFERLRSIMLAADLTTVQLTWREAIDRFRARNPFPVGNVVEDPATGAAAAALGAYLRWRGEVRPPARFTISQGVEMGRPSLHRGRGARRVRRDPRQRDGGVDRVTA